MELPVTRDQANYLNMLARVARLYRLTNERMQKDLAENLERIEKGRVPSSVRHQDAADIMVTSGQLDALTSVAYSVFLFPDESDRKAFEAHSNTVQVYLQTAMMLEANDYILMKH